MSERLTISYRLSCGPGESPEEKARDVALEQTVELPAECLPAAVVDAVVGRVESLVEEDGRHLARISYPAEAVGEELPQLLNLLFGNISMKAGIRVERIDWPPALLERLPGPRFGVDGLRRLCGVEARRPLLCAALKPLGLSSGDLAARCRELALAGVDIVKDDHSLADQVWAPFDERLVLCQHAVAEANAESGGSTRYFPNLTGSLVDVRVRAERIRAAGCRGAMISPLVQGFEVVRSLAETSELVLLGHPALTGAFFARDHGIAPELLLGDLFRLIGCDGVIYPNVGGRFVFDQADCDAINGRLRGPLGEHRPAFPVPGGGIDTRRIRDWIDAYGADTIFLIGTGLYRQSDLEAGARALVAALENPEVSS